MPIAPINYIEIRNGRPVIVGTGIKVAILAHIYLSGDAPIDWIVENYDLTPAQIYAALSYYYDHREELDRWLQRGEELAEKYGTPSEEVIARMRKRLKDREEGGE